MKKSNSRSELYHKLFKDNIINKEGALQIPPTLRASNTSSPQSAAEFDGLVVGSPQPVSFIHLAGRGQAAEVIRPEASSASASETGSASLVEASNQPDTDDDGLQFELEM